MKRALKVLERLDRDYSWNAWQPKNAFRALVATMLSAQCTDAQVEKVLPALFKRFKTPTDFANAKTRELEKLIRSTGYYKVKAKRLKAMSRVLLEQHAGRVPDSMQALVNLPGVGRKTANIVLEHSFNKVEGIAVDTHVWRLSHRLGFSEKNTQWGIESDLMAALPHSWWARANTLLIMHGRAVCKARNPKCCGCCVSRYCPYARV